jgi:copper chaperone CopZ
MEKKTFDLPAMYADHHVLEVRRILLETPGVIDVYASSAFHVVEVTYDPKQINDLEIAMKLDNAGYLGEWSIIAEKGVAIVRNNGEEGFFRHTEVYENTKSTISFAQSVENIGRPLWPCPGMGVMKRVEMDEEN